MMNSGRPIGYSAPEQNATPKTISTKPLTAPIRRPNVATVPPITRNGSIRDRPEASHHDGSS